MFLASETLIALSHASSRFFVDCRGVGGIGPFASDAVMLRTVSILSPKGHQYNQEMAPSGPVW